MLDITYLFFFSHSLKDNDRGNDSLSFWRFAACLLLTMSSEANSLVDDFAAVLDHTLTKYQGRIKPEEAESPAHHGLHPRGRHAA